MPRALTIQEQERFMLMKRPDARVEHREVGGRQFVIFTLRLQPAPASCRYTARMAYSSGSRPLVWIIEPEIVTSIDGAPTPHLNGDRTLCLFDPSTGEWDHSQPFCRTIVPWTMRWLFHYEHWLGFREWLGDEPVSQGSVN